MRAKWSNNVFCLWPFVLRCLTVKQSVIGPSDIEESAFWNEDRAISFAGKHARLTWTWQSQHFCHCRTTDFTATAMAIICTVNLFCLSIFFMYGHLLFMTCSRTQIYIFLSTTDKRPWTLCVALPQKIRVEIYTELSLMQKYLRHIYIRPIIQHLPTDITVIVSRIIIICSRILHRVPGYRLDNFSELSAAPILRVKAPPRIVGIEGEDCYTV